MVPTSQDSPQVHDILLLRSDVVSITGLNKPSWVTASPDENLWVVVRRATAPQGFIAVGMRGLNRNQRWGGLTYLADIKKKLRPSQLTSHMARRARIMIPAIAA